MKTMINRRPSPEMVIGLIALFVALSAGAYAAVHLPKNSVGAKQLKEAAVNAAEIADGAVTAEKLADGVTAGGPLGPGPQGPAGDPGAPGPEGPAGQAGTTSVVVRYGSEIDVPPTGPLTREVSASCGPGETAISGGALISAAASAGPDRSGEYFTYVVQTRPFTGNSPAVDGAAPNRWVTGVTNVTGQLAGISDAASHAKGYVICAA